MRLHHALRAAAGQVGGSYIPEDGLLAWYDGEGFSGSTVTNNVSGGADASVNGAPVVGSDSVVSNYIDFDGVDDSLWASINAARGDFTASMKVYVTDAYPSGDDISSLLSTAQGDDGTGYVQYLNYDHTSTDYRSTFHSKNTGLYGIVSWTPFSGEWKTVTIRVSSANVQIYIDGALDTNSNLNESQLLDFSRVSFASNAYSLAGFLGCNMTDMLVYNYARNDCEEINLI